MPPPPLTGGDIPAMPGHPASPVKKEEQKSQQMLYPPQKNKKARIRILAFHKSHLENTYLGTTLKLTLRCLGSRPSRPGSISDVAMPL